GARLPGGGRCAAEPRQPRHPPGHLSLRGPFRRRRRLERSGRSGDRARPVCRWLPDRGRVVASHLPAERAARRRRAVARDAPRPRASRAPPAVDVAGAALAPLGLGGLTWALIELPVRGALHPAVAWPGAVGMASLAALLVVERSSRAPMLDLSLFRSRQFSAA